MFIYYFYYTNQNKTKINSLDHEIYEIDIYPIDFNTYLDHDLYIF